MLTITIAAQKGGSGKSTLALHLATLAAAEGPTLLLDTDPQGSLTFWHERREAETPVLAAVPSRRIAEAQALAVAEGIRWCLIDTAPHDSASMAAAMRAADLVLIPMRPNALDVHAVQSTIRMANELHKTSLVVLSQTPARRAFAEPIAVREARELVVGLGGRVAETYIAARAIAAQSVLLGLSVGEMEPNGQSAAEFAAMWAEAKAAIEGRAAMPKAS